MKPSTYFTMTSALALASASMSVALPWFTSGSGGGAATAVDPTMMDPSADLSMGMDPSLGPDGGGVMAGPLGLGSGMVDPTADLGVASAASMDSLGTQLVQTPSVELDHQVNIQPETNVLPVSRLQPIINIAPPIIHVDPFYGGLDFGASPAAAGGFSPFPTAAGLGPNLMGGLAGDAMLGGLGGGGGGGGSPGFPMGPMLGDLGGGGINPDMAMGPMLGGNTLMKRQLGGPATVGGLPGPVGIGGPGGLTTDTVIQPIVNIEAYTPAAIPVSNPVPYQYPVPYAVGTPYPVRISNSFGRSSLW